MTFYWLTSLAESFFNSHWLELVIYFQTNEPDGEQKSFMANFSGSSDVRQGFKASLREFWDGDISRRTAESHRYRFLEGNDVSIFVTNWL